MKRYCAVSAKEQQGAGPAREVNQEFGHFNSVKQIRPEPIWIDVTQRGKAAKKDGSRYRLPASMVWKLFASS
jgi:hypothetical protein